MPRSRPAEFEVSSLVRAPPQEVWKRIVTAEGINHELRPWMRMTVPPGVKRLDPETVELGRPIGRSWVLLFGLLPFEYDDLTLVELEPERRFLERSPTLSQRCWQHERTVEPAEGGSRVTDRIRMEPRLGLPAAPLRPIFRAFFRHRHRRLRAWFAAARSPARTARQ
jgi:ligand-binding SRPBCC domain-containing protein